MTDASKTTFGELTSRHLGMTLIRPEQGDGVTLTHGGPMVLSSILHEDRAVTLRGEGRQMIFGPSSTACEVFTAKEWAAVNEHAVYVVDEQKFRPPELAASKSFYSDASGFYFRSAREVESDGE